MPYAETGTGLRTSPSPEAVKRNVAWRSTAGAEEATRQIDPVIETYFGAAKKTKPSSSQRLRQGLIGVVGNEAQNELVVVVDPSRVDADRLRRDLESARDAATATPPAGVAVVAACRTAADLLHADTVISERAWHPDAGKISFGYRLDADRSRWKVGLPEPEGAAARALADQLGDLVEITYGFAHR